MRDIKFRAWDKITKNMIELNLLGLMCEHQEDLIVYSVINSELEIAHSKKDNVPVMQYTGLKDKNDKEIYEGDILRSKTISGELIQPVEWKKWSYTGLVFAEKVEVIGNIYENPELLIK